MTYVSKKKKKGGKGPTNLKDCVDEKIQRHNEYIKKSKEILIIAARNIKCITISPQ